MFRIIANLHLNDVSDRNLSKSIIYFIYKISQSVKMWISCILADYRLGQMFLFIVKQLIF